MPSENAKNSMSSFAGTRQEASTKVLLTRPSSSVHLLPSQAKRYDKRADRICIPEFPAGFLMINADGASLERFKVIYAKPDGAGAAAA